MTQVGTSACAKGGGKGKYYLLAPEIATWTHLCLQPFPVKVSFSVSNYFVDTNIIITLLWRECWKGCYEFSNSLQPTIAFLTFLLTCLTLNFICSSVPSPPCSPPFHSHELWPPHCLGQNLMSLFSSLMPHESLSLTCLLTPSLHCSVPGGPSLTWTVAVASSLAPALTPPLVQATVRTVVWIKQIMPCLCSNPRTFYLPQRKSKGFFLRHKGWHDLVTSLTLSPLPYCSFLSSRCGTTIIAVILTAPPPWPLQ